MKKILLITLVVSIVVMFSACGKQDYTSLTPTRTPSSDTSGGTDPISNFNTVWTSENHVSGYEFNSAQTRTLSNFFGYSEAHKAWKECTAGYNGTTISGNCMNSSNPLRNYFSSSDYTYKPYPAPKNFGLVKYYKIRFAANVDEATREIIPGSAYLDIELNTATDSFYLRFSTVKTSLVVNNSTDEVTVTLKDGCGDITFKGTVQFDGSIDDAYITFLNTAESYKNPSCYYDGNLPDMMQGFDVEYPSTAPEGIHTSGGRGLLFHSGGTVLMNPFIEE